MSIQSIFPSSVLRQLSSFQPQKAVSRLLPLVQEALRSIGLEKIWHQRQVTARQVKQLKNQEGREREEALYDVKFVAGKIAVIAGGPSQARALVKRLCNGQDGRFNGKDAKFQFDSEKLLKALDDLPKSTVVQAVTGFQKGGTKEDRKLMARVSSQLVGLVQRAEVKRTFSHENKGCTLTQKAGHAVSDEKTGELSWVEGRSVSAELAKVERNVRSLANTAVLKIKQGGKEVVFADRGAKSHKVHLQEQRSKTAIVGRAEASGESLLKLKEGQALNGLTYVGEVAGRRVYEYRPLVFTMLDSSLFKGLATSAKGLIRRSASLSQLQPGVAKSIPIENERKFLSKIEKANRQRFSERIQTRGHVLRVGDQQILVREKPAIIQNHVVSSQSKSHRNRDKAHQDNFKGQMAMLNLLVDRNPKLGQDPLFTQDEVNRIRDMGERPGPELKNLLASKCRQAEILGGRLHMALLGFQANLTGEVYDDEAAAADLTILTGYQADYLGLAISFQCKSGNDRTAVAVALTAASHAFHALTGRYFNPLEASSEDVRLYQELYTQSLDSFGFAGVEASRGPVDPDGKSGLKIKKSPSAHKYLNVANLASGHII